ncbi:MAG: bifunctional 4-hydroxy-2-oxoglutarate aldolase/2-dehydro-3-deoxy-phosphogluconate aldolase [Cellvibrionaceae bacterium]|nr:bifunctional 4-hydroxy-2-oxoglutarate aldolase/2-dehydro-3-deoxy-phosphogluconate aldolase [Cellvibrionaceae bacterium]
MKKLEYLLAEAGVVPVLVIEQLAQAVPLARSLQAAGMKVVEVTLRGEHGLQAIAAIKAALPELVVGAGSIVRPEHLLAAKDAGAEFMVSPGSTTALVDLALELDLPYLPGVATVSEAMALAGRGFTLLKLFPAEAIGGVALLKAIAGPLPGLRFCPTGGIGPNNLGDYLALDNVACVGGSWMVDKQLLATQDWAAIEALASAALRLPRA